jgi:hypothetical protein
VFVVNGRGVREAFELLPALKQLWIFEAAHLPLPMYELGAGLPLLWTLQKLRLRASSFLWMTRRQLQCIEECAIPLPHDWASGKQLISLG